MSDSCGVAKTNEGVKYEYLMSLKSFLLGSPENQDHPQKSLESDIARECLSLLG